MSAEVLRRGSKGPLVERWQAFLIEQGFRPLEIDGDFGPKTANATMAFQASAGLSDDGVVGNRTYAAAMQQGFDLVDDLVDDSQTGPNWPPKPDFPAISGNDARQNTFGPLEFVSDPHPSNPEQIRITNGWAEENIVRVPIPQLAGHQFAGPNGEIRLHKKAAEQIVACWQAWEDAGLIHLVLTYAGSWVPRFIRGSRRTLSNHAFGTAFDINAAWNGLGKQPAVVGRKGSVRLLVPIAHQHGLYWGGHFSRKDGMHFEVAKILS
ncbi:MAG: M15 family metallopeptidase [Pseudomonadota bacterium]